MSDETQDEFTDKVKAYAAELSALTTERNITYIEAMTVFLTLFITAARNAGAPKQLVIEILERAWSRPLSGRATPKA